jgi:predicted dehydrogenase
MKQNAREIRVGIIGVNADRGWASMAHIPALKSLSQYKLTAISNWNNDVVQKAGKAFDVPLTFTSYHQLIESEEVDLVVITVRVPYHRELVTAALRAGKHVYCEWPLGKSVVEAAEMATLANERELHGAIGLQVRAVPAINYVKDLIADGYVGEVLSSTMVGAGIIQGAVIEQAFAYAADVQNSAGMLYSTLGNSVDGLCYCLGEFDSLNATAVTRRKTIEVLETGDTIPMTAFDQIAVTGVLSNGAVASVHYRGGMFRGTNFYWEINGTNGEMIITADGGHPAVFNVTIKGANGPNNTMQELKVPDRYSMVEMTSAGMPAFNLAHQYLRLANDLQNGTQLSPTFDDALIRHRMIAAIEASVETGKRQSYVR